MKKPTEGKFYVQWANESFTDAVEDHRDGYSSLEDAIATVEVHAKLLIDPKIMVVDWQGRIVYTTFATFAEAKK